MSLSCKIDEIRLAVNKIGLENDAFTETWLNKGIPDFEWTSLGVIQFRKDRIERTYGGVRDCTQN